MVKGSVMFIILTSLFSKFFGDGLKNLDHFLFTALVFFATVLIIMDRNNDYSKVLALEIVDNLIWDKLLEFAFPQGVVVFQK